MNFSTQTPDFLEIMYNGERVKRNSYPVVQLGPLQIKDEGLGQLRPATISATPRPSSSTRHSPPQSPEGLGATSRCPAILG